MNYVSYRKKKKEQRPKTCSIPLWRTSENFTSVGIKNGSLSQICAEGHWGAPQCLTDTTWMSATTGHKVAGKDNETHNSFPEAANLD